MSQYENMSCWEIMECSDPEHCPAKQNPEIPCWEIAEKLKTAQCVMNLCEDCIVYLVKTNDPVLSQEEHDKILNHRNHNKLEKCPLCEGNGKRKNC